MYACRSCLFLLAALSMTAWASDDKKVVCYLGTWAAYRTGNGKFEIENIQPELCTHLIYSFVGITSAGEVNILDEWMDLPTGKNGYSRFNSLKSDTTKTLVAIGGWNEGSSTYSAVMNDATLRATFVQNVVAFVQEYGFDGFDLDWEYPANRGGASTDLVAYVELIKELRTEFDKHGLLLTAAVGVGRYLVGTAYDVSQLSQYLDFINMMAYDMHGSWDGKTGQNAPLYPSSADTTESERLLNVNDSVHYWIESGADPSKLVLGMGTYGRTFTLSSTSNTGVGAACSGAGNSGPYTQEAGMLGYNEICEKILAGGWTVTWDDEQKVPYAVSGNQWVGYDNEESIRIKSEYILEMGLGGGMIWSLETDDFRGLCGSRTYPLLSTINDVLRGVTNTVSSSSSDSASSVSGSSADASSSDTSSSDTSSSDTSSSGSSSSSSDSVCTAEGYVRDPSDCAVFYLCILSDGVYVAHKFTCYGDLVFDPSTSSCNYASLVTC